MSEILGDDLNIHEQSLRLERKYGTKKTHSR